MIFASELKSEESSNFREPISDGDWRRIIVELQYRVSLLDRGQVLEQAHGIKEGIGRIDDIMTRYCELTCPSCQDPCCHGRKVFFNQADLLYLTALGEDIPPGQTRAQANDYCRYLGPHGCRLSRAARPYVCVWFLCDPQMELFQAEKPGFQRRLIRAMQEIRSCRLALESLYELSFSE